MPDISVAIRGIDELKRAFGNDVDGLLDDGLRPGITKGAVIVEGAWKDKAHKVTRKYAGSIGNEIEGSGASIEAHIGPQPGLGQPRGYTKGQTGHWKKPRNGRNTGDPQVYAVFEDQGTRYRPGHPAAEPAVAENEGRIERIIADEFDRAVQRRFR